MPPLIGVTVELGRKAAVGFGRDNGLNSCLRQHLAQLIRVEGPIREKLAARQPFDQLCSAAQIVGLARQQPEVDQVTKRVCQRHDLGGHSAARAPDGLILSPPFAL